MVRVSDVFLSGSTFPWGALMSSIRPQPAKYKINPKRICLHMELGDVSQSLLWREDDDELFLKSRYEAEKQCSYIRMIWDYPDDDDYYRSNIDSSFLNLLELLRDNGKNTVVRIWRGDNSEDLANFLFLMYCLKDSECRVWDYFLSLKSKHNEKPCVNYEWGQADDDVIKNAILSGNELSKEEISVFAEQWISICGVKTSLRVKDKQTLVPVLDESYYDDYLYGNLPSRRVSMLRYAMRMSNKTNKRGCGIPEGFIGSRLEAMIDSSKLSVIHRKKRSLFTYDNYLIKRVDGQTKGEEVDEKKS